MNPVEETLKRFLSLRSGQETFLEHEVKGLLRELGLPVPHGRFVPTGAPLPEKLDFPWPVVAKVASGRIAAKSDVGGVRTGIRSRGELKRAVAQLGGISGAEGVLLEEEAPPGLEVIVGGTVDPQFGPVVMFGLGGFFVELFRDVAFALAPTTRKEALRLVERTNGSRLLSGFRGRPPVDRQALAGVIVTVSELIASELVAEVDLNPVVLYPSGVLVLDAKLVVVKGRAWGK